jgi:hypothetical protein
MLVDFIVEGFLFQEVTTYLLVVGTSIGLVVGVAFGLAHGIAAGPGRRPLEPSRIRLRIRDVRTLPWRDAAHRFRTGLTGGLVAGLGNAIIRAFLNVTKFDFDPAQAFLTLLIEAAALGLAFGLAAGLTLGLMALCEAPLDTESVGSPEDLMRANRTTVALQVLLFGPVFAALLPLLSWLVIAPLQPLPPILGIEFVWTFLFAFIIGLIGGLGGGIAYALSLTAWGQWLVFGRFWLPLTGRLPWAVPAFLKDAYRRGVLRRVGVVYRFRHERLQDHLAAAYRSSRS